MANQFTEKEIAQISALLGVEGKSRGNNYRFELLNSENGNQLVLEIYPDIPIGKKNGNLISVFTQNTHLQLHFCTGFVLSEFLGEITFVAEKEGHLSGLTIEKEAGCSLYANVDSNMLSGDLTQLGPEVMLSGIALSLAEDILPVK